MNGLAASQMCSGGSSKGVSYQEWLQGSLLKALVVRQCSALQKGISTSTLSQQPNNDMRQECKARSRQATDLVSYTFYRSDASL